MSDVRRLLVVEDEPDVREVLVAYLRRDGHAVIATGDGAHAWQLFTAERPDLVLLDVRLPQVDGFELLRRIRERGDVPVIMVTARDEDIDTVLGLRMGADDYVVKPFNPAEVAARVAAVLRRANRSTVAPGRIALGRLTVDLVGTQALVDGRPVPLTASEYRLLVVLATHPRQTMTRSQLRVAALPGSAALDRVVDAHLTNLRRKLTDAGVPADLIGTARGLGYRLTPPDPAR
ncbi:response regulator transcription factor [Micromonospora sp. 067-2]|uniref:response regulator transcription factor n=1 Tax=Micromonospora sp. 067-2 TaxID=2789270 RepID=UPI00397A5502